VLKIGSLPISICKMSLQPKLVNHCLKFGDGNKVDAGRYQKLVGRLISLSHIHLNISYVVSAGS